MTSAGREPQEIFGMKVYAKDGEFELDPELVRSLIATYPACNVRRELERMHLWTLKNPSRRWDLPLRGIESWLRKATRQALEKKVAKKSTREAEVAYASGVRTFKPVTEAWWTSDNGVLARGRQLGLDPRRGESMSNFKTRVAEADKMARATRAGNN
jgi:hypothetical protein